MSEIKHSKRRTQSEADAHQHIDTDDIGLRTENISQGKQCTSRNIKLKNYNTQIAIKSSRIY